MRKIILSISVILMLTIVGAIGCSSSDDNGSPEDAVRGFLDAVQDKNPDKMASYCTADYAETLDLEHFKEQTEEVSGKYSNISTEVVEQGVNDAEVILSYDYEFNVEGEDISGNTTSTIFLIKVDNSWLINDDDDESAGENDEEKVRALLDEQIAAMNNVDVETVYSQRTPGYRSRVTVEEFQDFIMLAFAQFLPMVESGEAAVEITDLKIRVDGDWAYMTGTLGINGTSIQEYTDESPDIWHQIDGTWYNVETNPIFPGYDASELPE